MVGEAGTDKSHNTSQHLFCYPISIPAMAGANTGDWVVQ